uniref:SEP domain-containing protein n=1 Tax=Ditylenchus dipsaci TaxID=166011 RepID=A0A915CTZ7_9BILA
MSNIHSLESTKDKGKSNRGFLCWWSTHSGQEVLGPSGRANPDFASRLFDAARNAGAEQISAEEAEANSSGAASSTSFQGGVYRLGGHGQPSETIDKPAQAGRNAQPREAPVVVNFYVWTNGFSLDDGPLRTTEDPQNRPLLQAIMRGEIPQELVERHPGRKIDFHLIRKQTEYVPPKAKPFSGEGQRLGAIVPGVVYVDDHTELPVKKPMRTRLPRADHSNSGSSSICSNLCGHFQPCAHCPGSAQLCGWCGSNPGFRPFQFMTTYPSQAIEEESQTLKDAGILGASVLVKFI